MKKAKKAIGIAQILVIIASVVVFSLVFASISRLTGKATKGQEKVEGSYTEQMQSIETWGDDSTTTTPTTP